MNVLFVLYGGLSTNSGIPLMIHARELRERGHDCVVALPALGADEREAAAPLRVVAYGEVLASAGKVFGGGRPADILHAWTPREGVRRFVTKYLAQWPTPWVIYLEDNERWIAAAALALVRLGPEVLLQHTEEVISTWTPDGMPHPLRHEAFVGLADAAVVIQDKLASEVPPWVPCTTVMPGVDLRLFRPRPPDAALRARCGVRRGERVIVYPGGLNDFVRPGIEALCRAVGLINREGIPCRLLRSGPVPLDFLHHLPPEVAANVTDLGEMPREELPALLALADVLVQPGRPDPFEELRLPGKLPEFFAMGLPVVLPDANIASLVRDGVDAVIHRTGEPEELAAKCRKLFDDAPRAARIGLAGRRFAEKHFDPTRQAGRLLEAYDKALAAHDARVAARLFTADASETPVAVLLARKLRLLAAKGGSLSRMLVAHASSIEFARLRAQGLEAGMSVRDGEITALKSDLASLSALADSLKSRIAAQDAELAEAGAALRHCQREHGRTASQLDDLRKNHAQTVGEVAALRGSLSWRLTRPLRTVGTFLSRLRNVR